MAGFGKLDVTHDIPDGIGCDVEGTVRYIDQELFGAVTDGSLATG